MLDHGSLHGRMPHRSGPISGPDRPGKVEVLVVPAEYDATGRLPGGDADAAVRWPARPPRALDLTEPRWPKPQPDSG